MSLHNLRDHNKLNKVHARIMSQHVLWVDSIKTCVPANLADYFSVLYDKFHRTNFVYVYLATWCILGS